MCTRYTLQQNLILHWQLSVECLHSDHIIPLTVLSLSMHVHCLHCGPHSMLSILMFSKVSSYCLIWLRCLCTFVDSFQSCYKGGTEPGKYNLRWLIATYHFMGLF